MEIKELIRKHEEYKLSGINLIASENRISYKALEALSSDLAGRYGDEWYGGSKYAIEIYEEVEKLARKLFKVKHAFISPLSGNMCDLAVIFSFTRVGDEIAGISKENGGYPFGYEKFERKFYPLPVKDYVIDKEKIKDTRKHFPLILIASSIILFPHPINALKKHGGIISYDASHVFGLIAGGKFQQPLKEGCHVMHGSTHKTLPSCQGGIILTNDDEIAEKLSEYLVFDFEKGIGLVDNAHMHKIACLGIVMEEMLEIGKEYAENVIKMQKLLQNVCMN